MRFIHIHAHTDADAIVLDFGLRIEEVGARYPASDLVASGDIRMGLVNSGFMVLRNTAWLRGFLREWWYGPRELREQLLKAHAQGQGQGQAGVNIGVRAGTGKNASLHGGGSNSSAAAAAATANDVDADTIAAGVAWRRSLCDQDAFDKLFALRAYRSSPTSTSRSINSSSGMEEKKEKKEKKEDDDSVRIKIKVLPMDALNSHPPAMLHQQDSSPVLHLMGESTALRSSVFRAAWGSVCAARSGGVLPLQLGADRAALLRFGR
jgi:hypothetical protein